MLSKGRREGKEGGGGDVEEKGSKNLVVMIYPG